ncbi:MAG: hypothetical protein HQL28_04195, partial [Candidatus Omnitrophica bacterium]|nr:hypothetical protein [Candidatus Omnitrophota bacterium]
MREVIDGDTVVLDGGTHVRYLGMNTPERMVRFGKKWVYDPEWYGDEAKIYNQRLVEGN